MTISNSNIGMKRKKIMKAKKSASSSYHYYEYTHCLNSIKPLLWTSVLSVCRERVREACRRSGIFELQALWNCWRPHGEFNSQSVSKLASL